MTSVDSRVEVGSGIPDDDLDRLIALTRGPHVVQAARDALEDLGVVDGPTPIDPRDGEALDGSMGGLLDVG